MSPVGYEDGTYPVMLCLLVGVASGIRGWELPCDALSLLVGVASGIREWDLPCDALSLLVGVANGIQGWVGLTLSVFW